MSSNGNGREKRLTERVPMMMSKEEVAALDAWMFANHIRSRGEAIRALVNAGISGEAPPAKPDTNALVLEKLDQLLEIQRVLVIGGRDLDRNVDEWLERST